MIVQILFTGNHMDIKIENRIKGLQGQAGETVFPEYRITLIDRGDNVNDYRGKREGIKRIL